MACGRRFGKTELGVDRAVDAANRGLNVGWFAPTFRLLTEAWRELKRAMRDQTVRKSETEHRLELTNGAVVECWSLDDPDAGRGRKYGRVIIDEAAIARNLEEAWEQAIRPTLTDLMGDGWFLSTPKGYNYFHTLFQRGLSPEYRDYAAWQMPSRMNPFLPREELAAAEAESPERVFRQEYEASFVDDATIIFEREWWLGQNRYDHDAVGLWYSSVGRWLSWDTGLKDKVTNAYTARVVGELLPDYRLAIRSVWRDRLTFPALPAMIGQDAGLYNDGKVRGVLIEDKASGTSAYQTLAAAGESWLRPLLVPFMPSGSKEQRAEQAAVWCRNGCVLLPNPGPSVPWLMDFEDELFSAPLGEFMDQVDALSQLILYVEHYLEQGFHARRGAGLAA